MAPRPLGLPATEEVALPTGRPPESQPQRLRRRLLSGALVLAGVGAAVAYDAIGRQYYAGFRVPQGVGMYHLLPEELGHYLFFFSFGSLLWAALALALAGTSMPQAVVGAARRLVRFGGWLAAAAALSVAAASFTLASQVLAHTAVTDDEHAYRFIGQTLRTGSLVAPSPGGDLAFFQEQFIVLTETARYGKYTIGHPLLLAAGQALGLEALVVPLLTGLLVVVLHRVGRDVFDRSTALLAVLFLATSPQVLTTGATALSQPASALCLLAAVSFLLAAERTVRAQRTFLAASGFFLGYGVLVRPLPGLLFVAVSVLYLLVRRWPSRNRWLDWAAFLAPLAGFAAVMAWINQGQSGHALAAGHTVWAAPNEGAAGVLRITGGDTAALSLSLFASVLRLNFWMLGWPLSLVLCFFARRSPQSGLLWGLVAAALGYRLVAPKVGVGITGPQYLFEVVPLLCLLAADGLLRVVRRRPSLLGFTAAEGAAALVMAGALVNLTLFLPPKLADLRRSASAQLVVQRMLQSHQAEKALVFHESVVPFWTGLSWAYFPRCNAPSLDDDVLFVRLQRGRGLLENLDFWRRRFPDRRAWYFGYPDREPVLVALDDYVRRQELSAAGR